MRLGARVTQRLTNRLRLALEPECLENPSATTREKIPEMERTRSETLKLFAWFQDVGRPKHAPLFHTINAMVAIFLLPRLDALGQQSDVELLKRTGFA